MMEETRTQIKILESIYHHACDLPLCLINSVMLFFVCVLQKATITILLQCGADATVCSPTGETALSFAACQGQLDAVEQLLEYGADPDIANVVCIEIRLTCQYMSYPYYPVTFTVLN